MTQKELYDMNLHEKRSIVNSTNQTKEWVLRVIGGWIYYRQQFLEGRFSSGNLTLSAMPQIFETATFVPEPKIERVQSASLPKETLTRITEMKNNILNYQIEKWLDENYDEKHKLNSLRKHLDVDDVSKCLDAERKQDYLKYLQSK